MPHINGHNLEPWLRHLALLNCANLSLIYAALTVILQSAENNMYLMFLFIGPCIIVIVEEWKTNLTSLAILFHFLCAQHVSDINISTIRSLRLCWWITTSVVLFSVRCVLELLVRLVLGGVRFAGFSQHSRKLLMVDILMSETCWAHKKWKKNNKWHQVGL